MTREALKEILRKHKLWLQGKYGGERANLEAANLRLADLRLADLRLADLEDTSLEGANLRCANLRGTNLERTNLEDTDLGSTNLEDADLRSTNLRGACLGGANMQGADIDDSAWPLWCGSLRAHVDDRIAVQLLYHALSVVQHSPYVSEDIKRTLLTPEVVGVANRFHRVDECGELEAFSGGEDE